MDNTIIVNYRYGQLLFCLFLALSYQSGERFLRLKTEWSNIIAFECVIRSSNDYTWLPAKASTGLLRVVWHHLCISAHKNDRLIGNADDVLRSYMQVTFYNWGLLYFHVDKQCRATSTSMLISSAGQHQRGIVLTLAARQPLSLHHIGLIVHKVRSPWKK